MSRGNTKSKQTILNKLTGFTERYRVRIQRIRSKLLKSNVPRNPRILRRGEEKRKEKEVQGEDWRI